jgi:hypothetical protein
MDACRTAGCYFEKRIYDIEYLKACPHHDTHASTASDDLILPLQFISTE